MIHIGVDPGGLTDASTEEQKLVAYINRRFAEDRALRPIAQNTRRTPSVLGFVPEMLPRPEGMSRQIQRRLFRAACKANGVNPETAKTSMESE